jgi:C1A family cysteine protease
MPAPIFNQGDLGSCTGNGCSKTHQFARATDSLPALIPSRLFIYYNERVIEHTTRHDAGAQIRDGLKVLATLGAPDEQMWPYDIAKFTHKPPAKAYKAATLDQAIEYYRVDNSQLDQLRACLADGYPVVFGFTVYASFESQEVARTGVVPMPGKDEQVLGGHCTVLVGFDDHARRFTALNSWGENWGDHGYFTMPYDYLTNTDLADDFWTIRHVERPA